MNLLEQILRKIFCLHEWKARGGWAVKKPEWAPDMPKAVWVCKKCGKTSKITFI